MSSTHVCRKHVVRMTDSTAAMMIRIKLNMLMKRTAFCAVDACLKPKQMRYVYGATWSVARGV